MALLDLVFPRRCVACGLPGDCLCRHCRARLPPLPAPLCARCGAPTAWPVERCLECAGRRLAFASARAAVAYADAVPVLVAAWKERGLRTLARVAAEVVAAAVPMPPRVRALTFVPPDGDRSVRRGHHPPERLARELSALWGVPTERLLERRRDLARQRGLSVAERRRNVRRAFAASSLVPPRVVLVDDVYTTGSTATAAATALRKGGAARVDVVTFGRAVRLSR